ncbi:hypothetical protein V6U78_01510 [Marinospirillum sp. MEB164]|uniref:VacJ n=1 Tax=Marinospirillum alkalitolerans TaxID=3123374 RepID=A0ABW8PU02_9GAMM
MKMLNRSAINIKLKQPFVDWINGLDDESDDLVTLAEVNQEATTYLVPELEDGEDLQVFLEERYVDLFENELLSWEEDPAYWPEELSREVFDAFIQVELSFMVFDLDDQAPLLAQVVDEDEDLDEERED